MRRITGLVLLLVLCAASTATTLEFAPLRAAVESRLVEIGDPPTVPYGREAAKLEKGLDALEAAESSLPTIDRKSIRRAVKRIARSRTEDVAILTATDDLLLELHDVAARGCDAAEIMIWTRQTGKSRRRVDSWHEEAVERLGRAERNLEQDARDRAARHLVKSLKLAWKADPPAPEGSISVLHVSDSHGHLGRYGPKDDDLIGKRGGISRVATVLTRVRTAGGPVLAYHAGDFFTGSLFHNETFGIPELRLLSQLGFNGMAIGNHEFDYGPDVLAYALSEAFPAGGFPVLAANLDWSGYPVLGSWLQDWTIEEIDGVRVGVFGLTVPGDPLSTPDPVVVEEDVATIAGVAVSELRAAGADVVVCISHLGLDLDRLVVASTIGIDLVLGGHTHAVLEEPLRLLNAGGTETVIVHSGSNYDLVGRVRFRVERGAFHLVSHDLIEVTDRVPVDEDVQDTVDALKQAIEARQGPVFSTVIATARERMTATWDEDRPERDTALGNLVTDAYRRETGTELGITALGLVRDPLEKGPITPADAFGVVSYGYDEDTGLNFKLATMEITGAELIEGLETTLAFYGLNDDFFLQVSGMEFAFDPGRAPGERVLLETVLIGGQPIDPARAYSVTVNAGVVALLPMIGVDVGNLIVREPVEFLAVHDHLRALGEVRVRPEGRIREVK